MTATALAVAAAPARSNPFEPDSIPQAIQLSDMLAKSSLVPSALRGKPQDILLILATARELGIGPMQALSDVNVIQGKPVMSADLMLSLCKRRPDVCKYIRLVESTDTRAVYETHRVGSPEPERFTFTMDDAKRLGLDSKDNYRKQAKTMLRRRAAAALARETYQDLVRGYDPDEAEDFVKPAPRQVESVPVEPPPAPPVEVLPVAGPLDPGIDPPSMDDPPPEEGGPEEPRSPEDAMRDRINACRTMGQLLLLGQELKKAPQAMRDAMRAAYSERQHALASKAGGEP